MFLECIDELTFEINCWVKGSVLSREPGFGRVVGLKTCSLWSWPWVSFYLGFAIACCPLTWLGFRVPGFYGVPFVYGEQFICKDCCFLL